MSVSDRLVAVRADIAAACAVAGRDVADVRIVGISKQQPDVRVRAAVAAGLRELGENRVAELEARAAAHPDVAWHFVGQLQRRKVARVVGLATLVHSVDRVVLADAISRHAQARGVVQDVLIQVDRTSRDDRGGVPFSEVSKLVAYAAGLPGIRVTGLMTMPPVGEEPRQHFRALRELRDVLRADVPDLTDLSMGMSGDFAVAVEEGATLVRPGTALFGRRDSPTDQDAA